MLVDPLHREEDEDAVSPRQSFANKAEQIQELVNALAENYRDANQINNIKRKKIPPSERNVPGLDLSLHKSWLAEAHSYFRKSIHQKVALTYTSEWVLDNYYIIRQALLQIKEDLPSNFYNQLPRLTGGPLKGYPRIYAITRSMLTFQHFLIDPIELQKILRKYQNHVSLTMGELWAFPIFLRYGLIEVLSHSLASTIRPEKAPHLPPIAPQLPGVKALSLNWGNEVGENNNQNSIANIIHGLRTISAQNWSEFFESVSCLEKTLRKDPAGIYSQMDFKTRDLYRAEIESLSFASRIDENEIAEKVIDLAGTSNHIGEFLLGEGRAALEQEIGYHPTGKTAFMRWVYQHPSLVYFSSILVLTIGILVLILAIIQNFQFPENLLWSTAQSPGSVFIHWMAMVLMTAAILIPVLTITTSLINWLITLLIPPRILPKLDFKSAIPKEFQTLVVIPGLIVDREDIESLTQQLEMHYLRNPEPGLLFALLTDFRDADSETLPEDEDLVDYALQAIDELNKKYGRLPPCPEPVNTFVQSPEEDSQPGNDQLFFVFHRKRLWNSSEGKWIGWERKRGKLNELNQLLRGEIDLTYTTLTSDMYIKGCAIQNVRFVITLDADTILPHGAACRLVGTLAHPLNQAVFDETTGKVVSGYTILQPRMEIHPRSARFSWFTRFFAGDAGLDLYTLSVSDAYQDLFGEGSYVGKGIYDVDAFEYSVNKKIHENTVLSHDLLEGLMGRAALVTDITMIEDYPQNYFIQISRMRRWIRGDWQLLPWLFRRNHNRLSFSWIDRWKLFDNLRRSLLAPALLLIFLVGFICFPTYSVVWTAIVLLSLAIPLLTGLSRSALQIVGGENPRVALQSLGWNFLRWLLAIAFLPYEAYICIDAIFTTLYRLSISRRDLLQWTTAAQTARVFGLNSRKQAAWQKMMPSSAVAVALIVGTQIISAHNLTRIAPILIITSPVLILWLLSPAILWWVNRPIIKTKAQLNPEQVNRLRQITRLTWGFFERFVGPEDHWLPPDHFQETPNGTVAHRTSPTNIGLLLTSTLAAYDMGYLDQLGLATRLDTTMDSLDRLERFRGHFLNWYDTLTLQPLTPRYVSTVDSGNLAASFIVTAQGCKSMPNEQVFRWNMWQGYQDTLSNLTETLTWMKISKFDQQVEEINLRITGLQTNILAVRSQPEQWYSLFLTVSGPFWKDLSSRLMKLLEVGRSAFDLKTLEKLQEVAAQVNRHHLAVQRTITELIPWIPLLESLPAGLQEQQYAAMMNDLKGNLSNNPLLREVPTQTEAALSKIISIQKILSAEGEPITEHSPIPNNEQNSPEMQWLQEVALGLEKANRNAAALLTKFEQIATRANQFVNEMEFGFLYHTRRKVFHIGLNLDEGLLDQNYYDLLASEARIASIIAIAKGEVPIIHWLYLGRPVTRVEGLYVLFSWSATMFEYLMPPLFLHSYPGTLLSDSTEGAVVQQIAYGKEKKVPWGISESGFYHFDANQNYQYRAFGVPGLGLKRGAGDDLVITPYASLMAVRYDPQAVVHNLLDLIDYDMIGHYGMYEAIDFTSDRLSLDETSAVVSEYMAHHQGMIMMAMANYFHSDIMVQRMHNDLRIQSVELLLQEKIPQFVPSPDLDTEEVKGEQRLTAVPVEITPWSVPVTTPIPQMNLLSNGNYNVLISNMGGGYSSWRDIDLTRWQADGVLDPWGTWIYIQESDTNNRKFGKPWSVAHQPISGVADDMLVTYFSHMAVFRRTKNGINSTMDVTVAPDDPVEIRRVHLHNTNEQSSKLRLTSYGEVILASQAADVRHPAFNKLFIESEFITGLNLQIFKRRPRSNEEAPLLMGHMVIVEDDQVVARYEADRNRFIGRNQTLQKPAALTSTQYLTGTTGATFDPIFSLGVEVELEPHESKKLAYLTFAGESREEIISLARRFNSWNLVTRTFHQANIGAQTWLAKQDIDTQSYRDTLQILSALLYSFKELRSSPEIIASNRLGQPGLWRFGISGDYPILLVEVDLATQVHLVREALQVHKFLRSRRFVIDVVIINRQPTDYGAELNGLLYRMVSKMKSEEWLNQRGGIFILYNDQMSEGERILLKTAARVVLAGAKGSLGDQLPGYSMPVHHLPNLSPTRKKGLRSYPSPALRSYKSDENGKLQFFNGYGGFSADGREYVIDIQPGIPTPAPWVNVIGYPLFGFMVSESGSQCTWALNSGENRLTPWSNDPVRDPTGEALYLRDEETGEVWTPTPRPGGADQSYRVTHGAGYTRFEHGSHGLRQVLTLFASPEDPVKIIHLEVKNTLDHTRRITTTQYVEWVLGTTHAANINYIIPEYDSAQECLLATNPYSVEFGTRVAFLIASKSVHGLTADRTEFLGRGGTLAFPIALQRLGLEARITPGEDPCAVLQMHLDLLPGATEEVYFVLGQGKDREHSLALAEKYHNPDAVAAAFEHTRVFWDHLLGTIQVHTPEPATDLILNRWMLYQSLSCRIWGRTAFYQSSGAFGFRDQLQDVAALLPIDPQITRNQILNAAQRQFEEGDVLHWWHPPSGRGVRTRFSDDLLWLPYVTALYIEATGDTALLEEKIPFRVGPLLVPGEHERYGEYPQSQHSQSLLEHCLLAIKKGATIGVRGLPLMGTGDWNDGMNRVGEKGIGESVWLAWFLCDVLKRFASVCEGIGDVETARRLRTRAEEYAAAVERSSWDGEWYRRAYYDNGASLGSITEPECQIDAIAQSWAVISGSGELQRSRRAMQSVLKRLVRPEDRLSLLFTPPFDKTPHDPGYIKGYLPGTRENGGQYTHAAIWTAWAFTSLGDGKQAGELFDMLNPIFQSDSPRKATEYRVEPYAICADIYSSEPYVRRGGWTWYTGSAAWMYRLGMEAMLGFRKIGNTLQIDPVIPPAWDGFSIRYQFGQAVYHIQVNNPQHVSKNVRQILLDGQRISDGSIPLVDDQCEHKVIVSMGNREE